MKRAICIFLCVLLSALTAGCGNSGQEPENDTKAVGSAAQNTEVDGTGAAVTEREAHAEQIRLFDGGLSVISPGSPKVEELPFYVGLFDGAGDVSYAQEAQLEIRLVNSMNVEVYSGTITLEPSRFDTIRLQDEGRNVLACKVTVPGSDILVGETSLGTIEVTGRNDAGQTLPKAVLATELLPANRNDKISVVSMTADRLPPPNSAINVYVTFFYGGTEDIDMFTLYYQEYAADGSQLFSHDVFNVYSNVAAGSEFTMLLRVDPNWEPASLELKSYLFSEEDPQNPSNTITYWMDDFDDQNIVYID